MPPSGIVLILSTPPATTISAQPQFISAAAKAIACSPEEQKRLTVIAAARLGIPARMAIVLATFQPCSISGKAQPMITSSTWFRSRNGTRSRHPLTTTDASSSGLIPLNWPLGALPVGVRAADTIKICCIVRPLSLVPQRFAVFQHMSDSILGFYFAA